MLKARADSEKIIKNYKDFEKKYGMLTRKEYKEMGISRRVFLGSLKLHHIWLMRILVRIHSIITG